MRSFRYELVDGSTLVDAEHVKFTMRVTVVSRTLNKTHAISKRKTSYAINVRGVFYKEAVDED